MFRLVKRLDKAHDDSVWSVAWTAQGSILTASVDEQVKVISPPSADCKDAAQAVHTTGAMICSWVHSFGVRARCRTAYFCPFIFTRVRIFAPSVARRSSTRSEITSSALSRSARPPTVSRASRRRSTATCTCLISPTIRSSRPLPPVRSRRGKLPCTPSGVRCVMAFRFHRVSYRYCSASHGPLLLHCTSLADLRNRKSLGPRQHMGRLMFLQIDYEYTLAHSITF